MKKSQENKKSLSTLERGTIFNFGFADLIFLKQVDDRLKFIYKEPICHKRLDSKSNNYNGSELQKYLEEVQQEIEDKIGTKNLFEYEADLTSLDGLKDYGKIKVKFAPLTWEDYREDTDIIFNGEPILTITPYSTPARGYSCRVCCVGSGGALGYGGCDWGDFGVRPVLFLSSSILVS